MWRQAPQALELEELQSVAYMGLVGAAERWPVYCEENGFDPTIKSYFTAFANRRVRGAIHDSLRHNDWARRSLREKAKAINSAGSQASDTEISRHTGMSEQEIRDTRGALNNRPVSIDASGFDRESQGTVEDSAFERSVCAVVVQVLAGMSDLHRTVVALHYYSGKELREVALIMGITESRASHLHTDAIMEVRESLLEVVVQ